MTEPRTLSVYQAAAAFRKGKLTAEALVASCLERIQARKSLVRADTQPTRPASAS
jgi:Asp-tRNA(Asn)/Glu-tRNA(Gln) amidotransferase A subunit family amidase